jgi:hypothetical protein
MGMAMSVLYLFRSKIVLYAAAISFAGFIAIQFIRPTLKNPPVTADLNVPPAVKQILKNSCYNCHSNETKLLWFDQVAPGYWLVARDVRHARVHMNFSEIGKQPAAQQSGTLFEAVNRIEAGSMPPKQYTLLHPGAVVTPEQLATLKDYLKTLESGKVSTPAQIAAADEQFFKWIASQSHQAGVLPAPNGIAFPADYMNWKPLSTTDRVDNNTLRVILGNDVAIKAVKDNQINPWPDGTMFAKIAWAQQIDANGNVRAGEFKQVEFMIKDSVKYANTEGWGWGRWLGAELKPFGKDEHFVNSCTACHAPMKPNDFVFTMPIRTQPLNP